MTLVNIMSADDLATLVARPSAEMIFTQPVLQKICQYLTPKIYMNIELSMRRVNLLPNYTMDYNANILCTLQ